MTTSVLTSARVLVVDDEPDMRWGLSQALRANGLQPLTAGDGQTGLHMVRSESPDAMLLDLRMPGMGGLEVLRETRRHNQTIAIIVLTAYGNIPVAVEAVKSGADEFLRKPFEIEQLVQVVHRALEQHRSAPPDEAGGPGLAALLPDMVYETDTALRLTYANRAALTCFGYGEGELASGIDISQLFDHGEVEEVRDLLSNSDQEAGSFPSVYTAKRKDGEPFLCEITSAPFRAADGTWAGSCGVMRDVTPATRAREQIGYARRMESVGRLVDGVAHKFSNLLTTIMGCGNLALDEIPPDGQLREDLERILGAGQRATAITHQLWAFAHRRALSPTALDLNEIAADIPDGLNRAIREGVEFDMILAEDLGRILADRDAVKEVLFSLATNACQAMPDGGKLTIETANATVGAEFCRTHPETTPGRHIMLAVSDTGCGMAEHVRAHLFEPFFTTKEVGEGIGLGLPTVYGIVRQSGGHIYCHSEPGRGATFRLYFPRAAVPLENALPQDASEDGMHRLPET